MSIRRGGVMLILVLVLGLADICASGGRGAAQAASPPTATPYPTNTPYPTPTPAPSATPPPTNTPTAGRPAITVAPTSGMLRGLTSVSVEATGWPAFAHLQLSWQDMAGTAVLSGGYLAVDDNGYGLRSIPVPRTVSAGTYRVVAQDESGRHQHASAVVTLTPYVPAPSGDDPGVWCLVGTSSLGVGCVNLSQMTQHLTEGALSWWSTFTNDGRRGVVESVFDALFSTIDLSGGIMRPLDGLLANFTLLAFAALRGLVVVRLALLILDLFAARQAGRALIWLVLGIVLVYWGVGQLPHLEQGVASWINSWVASMDRSSAGPIDRELGRLMHPATAGLSGRTTGFETLLALLCVLVAAPLFLIILLTRLGADGLIILLAIIGPLYIALLFLEGTRQAGLWWIRSQAALFAYAPLYALLAAGGLALAETLLGSGGSVFSDIFVMAALGLLLIALLLTVPEVAAKGTALFVRGGGGLIDATKAPGVTHARKVQGVVRGMMPW